MEGAQPSNVAQPPTGVEPVAGVDLQTQPSNNPSVAGPDLVPHLLAIIESLAGARLPPVDAGPQLGRRECVASSEQPNDRKDGVPDRHVENIPHVAPNQTKVEDDGGIGGFGNLLTHAVDEFGGLLTESVPFAKDALKLLF